MSQFRLTQVSDTHLAPRFTRLTENFQRVSVFGEDRGRFDEAGWCFIGLNSLIMNTGLASEAEQFDWLASELARVNRKPVALFVHKPLYLNLPVIPNSSHRRYATFHSPRGSG
jgi:3',5'-cyclic AMP phosphodiesterase CpdA